MWLKLKMWDIHFDKSEDHNFSHHISAGLDLFIKTSLEGVGTGKQLFLCCVIIVLENKIT